MRLTEMWELEKTPTLSFEFFPPRSEKGEASLEKVLDKLQALKPDFVSVTFGAGGSTREGSLALVSKLSDRGLEVLAYFACFGLGPETILTILDAYRELGVENVLAVRGDPPEDPTFEPHPESFAYAKDLVGFIRSHYDFCMGVAGYPEGHVKAPSVEKDIEYLKMKVDAGADFIIANYFYDNTYFFDFLDRCAGADIDVPIVPGVMPIYSVKMLEMLAGLCGATITEAVRNGLASLDPDDKEALNAFGVEYALNQCTGLLEAGVPGLHVYTMDRSKSALGLVGGLREKGLL